MGIRKILKCFFVLLGFLVYSCTHTHTYMPSDLLKGSISLLATVSDDWYLLVESLEKGRLE